MRRGPGNDSSWKYVVQRDVAALLFFGDRTKARRARTGDNVLGRRILSLAPSRRAA